MHYALGTDSFEIFVLSKMVVQIGGLVRFAPFSSLLKGSVIPDDDNIFNITCRKKV